MEVVNEKYQNFKNFCQQALPNNEFVLLLQNTPLEVFLHTLKIKRGQLQNESEIIDAILSKAGIEKSQFSPEQHQKFARCHKDQPKSMNGATRKILMMLITTLIHQKYRISYWLLLL